MTLKLQERVASAGGCEIHYLESGGGPVVVMLHGAGGLRVDEQAFGGLAAHYRLLAPSLPGFDQSTLGGVESLIDIADVMADFIRGAAGGRAHVIGESFGGAVASWLAIRHPEVVDRLVLAAPGGLRQEGGPRPADLTPAEANIILFGRPATEEPSPEEQQRRLRNRQHASRINTARPAFDPELFEQLTLLAAPTLVIWGSADRMIFPQQAKHFLDQIPDARLVTIEGAPHVLSAAVPDEFLAAVLQFLGAEPDESDYTDAINRAAV